MAVLQTIVFSFAVPQPPGRIEEVLHGSPGQGGGHARLPPGSSKVRSGSGYKPLQV